MKIVMDGQVAEISAGGSSMEAYSTEERRIGTWINGKPLYRRVITDMVLPDGVGKSYSDTRYGLAALKIDELITMSASLTLISGSQVTLPFTNISGSGSNMKFTHNKVAFSADALVSSIFGNASGTSWANNPLRIVVEYTKTTDQATIALPAVEAFPREEPDRTAMYESVYEELAHGDDTPRNEEV